MDTLIIAIQIIVLPKQHRIIQLIQIIHLPIHTHRQGLVIRNKGRIVIQQTKNIIMAKNSIVQ
jgi:hypothetical protein